MKTTKRPPKPRKRKRPLAFGFLVLLLALGIGSWQALSWWSAATAPVASGDRQTVKLKIPDGSTAQDIGQDLKTLGLIRDTKAWGLWARWLSSQESKGGFKAGTYEFAKTESMQAIATKIWKGEIMQLSFTIPEGWSVEKMAAYFEQQGWFTAQDFLAATNQVPLTDYPWLPQDLPKGRSRLEGYLYPDTYQIASGATAMDVVRQMLGQFEKIALPVYQQYKGQTPMTLAQWVTLASIVEKESVVPTERNLIAGVFVNRLKKGMALGSDPTVEYGLGVTQTPDRPLTFAQVDTPNPYNTYINPGLPPTPIASPGVASLKATLAPETTDYLYFVARYDGTHIFSRTMDEHLAAQDAIHDKRDAEKKTDDKKPG
jgi:UPF0755 protein